ncbi:hypothetical protein GCM10010520_23400 [Rhizobium viscosum]|uniref:RiboL-PSP-HEPN domain-containing protein n=1 Tax=Rhizobium viscosum TaxID=1673 RepID=A0ABR9IIV1_RHIVS|nr:hypothetical protein [Rhizobium viscosum]MBE1503111.1 hypothetical protein [Rhizobium viscosum]
MPKVAPLLLMFAPEYWGEVTRFGKYYGETYKLEKRDHRAVVGVGAHFEKALRLQSLAVKLKPGLAIDHQQLEENGHSPAENGAELATVIEASFLELYSSIDCTVKVLRAIYSPGTRGFKDSTRGLFQDPDKLTGSFPDHFKQHIREATWFKRLVNLRDELTHLSTGHVSWDAEADLVNYMHHGLTEADKPLIINDVFGALTELTESVNRFLGTIFHHLNGTLSDKPVFQICGMVDGRLLQRYINPQERPLSFNSGQCGSWVWFEQPDFPTCPFKDNCGAYLNKAPAPA